MDMWTVSAFNVIHIGRSPGGERFTQFVDAIIRAHSFVSGVPDAAIATTLRTNKQDGGVDTKMDVPVPGDTTGWMGEKTLWQYKATERANIKEADLHKEINSWYSKQCIEEGYAYRFCICDDIPASTKADWEKKLTRYARQIKSDSPEVKVLTASDLAAWASRFPALILTFLHPQLAGTAIHLRAWGDNITVSTRQYVNVQAWEPIQQEIRLHIAPGKTPPNIVQRVQGESGVGKTRMVYEALASVQGIESQALYTDDEQLAQQIARHLANDASLKAILVADECSVQATIQLENLLRGCKNRIRVIAIDNSGERPSSESPEYWVQKIPEATLEEILQANFPHVPGERRRAYARLSRGFVRLAADMCNYDGEIAAVGHIGPVARTIQDYFITRFPSEEVRKVVEALALIHKIGFRDEVEEELDLLCSLVGLDRRQVEEQAHRLHDVPGFVARAGRYFYVTPEIIAQIAFERAWRRWGAPNPEQFLKRIPDQLLESFIIRVAGSAPQEVHRLVGEFFRRWANQLEPGHLAVIKKVDRLIKLVEIDPDTYFPILQKLIEQATPEQLRGEHSEAWFGDWGPRRHLVWLAERMAAFPEYFDAVESILLRLALAESEPSIGNNSTHIWEQLFRIALSSTAISFPERLKRLEERICSDNEQVSLLALGAFDRVFDAEIVREIGPEVVAGRIPPTHWYPKTHSEYRACWDEAVSLLRRLSASEVEHLRTKSSEIVIKHMRGLLSYEYLDDAKAALAETLLSDRIRVQAVTAIEQFLHFDCRQTPGRPRRSASYVQEVKKWLTDLKPPDLHGRLVTAIGVDSWDHTAMENEKAWQAEVQAIATELYQQPEILKLELQWLYSEDARSAAILGQEIGKLDTGGSLLDLMVESCLQFQSAALARGYVFGLLTNASAPRKRLNKLLDKMERTAPALAYELFMAGDSATDALHRTLRLIDAGQLSAVYLQGFIFGGRLQHLSANDITQALKRLVAAVEAGNTDIIHIAIQFVDRSLRTDEEHGIDHLLDNEEAQVLIWRLMETTSENLKDHSSYWNNGSYWWARVLEALIPISPERVAYIAAKGVAQPGLTEEASKLLIEMAPEYPRDVMEQTGRVMLDAEEGWRFSIGKHADIIQALPEVVVISWVQSYGVESARQLARHLPAPYLGAKSEPIVPPVTEFVLKTFQEDDEVFRAFHMGMHSLQWYSGDIASAHEQEAEVARKFLNHPLRRIREWAEIELETALHFANQERVRDEEERIA